MARVPSPRAYEFARLRFLLEARNRLLRGLGSLGERLLRRNPKDAEVKYELVRVLVNSGLSDAEQRRALSYAEQLVREAPEVAKYHAALGSAHLFAWAKTKDQGEGDKALAAYQRYLQLAPPNAPFRKHAESHIKWIQRTRARRAKKGG